MQKWFIYKGKITILKARAGSEKTEGSENCKYIYYSDWLKESWGSFILIILVVASFDRG